MKIIAVGKTTETYLQKGIDEYLKRLKKYSLETSFEIVQPKIKSNKLPVEEIKKIEGAALLKNIPGNAFLILLDEKGKQYSSVQFAEFLSHTITHHKNPVFLIGGAYGFSEEIYQKANAQISLSKMTFSHQMVRLFLVEQIYRAATILKGEKYHHE
jgi:23S rRNA (pseudouridine1915-N3)-methyltransferase